LKETPIVSLRARLVLSMGCVLALMLALGGVLTFWRAVHSVRVEMQSALAAARKTIANGVREVAGSPHVTLDLRDLVATFDGNRHVQARLEMVPSMLLAQSSLRVPERPVPSFLRHALEVPVADAVLELPADGNTLVLVLHADPTNEIGEVWEQAIDALALFGLFFVLLVLLINWSVGRALRPLSRLTTAFGRIGAGDHTTRVPAQGAAELAQLAAGFNLMAERLGQIATQNQRLQDQVLMLQEEERSEIARDLHDEVGQFLVAAQLDAAALVQAAQTGSARDLIAQAMGLRDCVGHMQRHVRAILHQLQPVKLLDIGLQVAITRLAAFWRARRPDMAIDLRFTADETLLEETVLQAVYRLVQEALSNAVRHGQPSRVEIEISQDAAGLVVRVSDDGVGPAEDDMASDGLGLIGMRERIEALGGTLRLRRNTPSGLEILAALPETSA
jgi:two-component system sensor histidine kinase UhpB